MLQKFKGLMWPARLYYHFLKVFFQKRKKRKSFEEGEIVNDYFCQFGVSMCGFRGQ